MNVFQKITPNRSAIALKLLTNEVIVKLLNDYSDKPLSELQMPDDVFDLYKTKIFTRTNVEGLGMALWFVYQVWPVGTWLAGAVVAVILGFAIGGDR